MKKYKSTNLKFVLKILPSRKNGLRLEDGYKILELIRKGHNSLQIGKAIDRSDGFVRGFFLELKKAANANMTLEAYFKKQRPFRNGKQVVK